MSNQIFALERCESYGLSPDDVLSNQMMISMAEGPAGAAAVPGMSATPLTNCTLHAGAGMPVILMEDAKGRVFGAFIGVGVESGGALVSAESFGGFNSKSPTFEKSFASFVEGVSGRFAILLDLGKRARLYTDPMGHMALFYNPQTRRAATAEYLVLDAPATPGPLSGSVARQPEGLSETFLMGHGLDAQTRLLLGGHMLDLGGFEPQRVWPLKMSLRKVTRAKSGPVIDRMAKRLKAVVGALAQGQPASLVLEGSAADRLTLAALRAAGADLAQSGIVEPSHEAQPGLAALLAERAGQLPETLSIDKARAGFAAEPPARRRIKHTHWVRTGCALRLPEPVAVDLGALRPAGAISFEGAGLDALQGGWDGSANAAPPLKSGLTAELACVLGAPAEGERRAALEPLVKAWKASLPKSLQGLACDFIRFEMHQPARAVAWHGEARQFAVSPFSDRVLIEQALRLPADMRRGPALVEALLAKLAPELAGLPYPGESDAVAVQAAE